MKKKKLKIKKKKKKNSDTDFRLNIKNNRAFTTHGRLCWISCTRDFSFHWTLYFLGCKPV